MSTGTWALAIAAATAVSVAALRRWRRPTWLLAATGGDTGNFALVRRGWHRRAACRQPSRAVPSPVEATGVRRRRRSQASLLLPGGRYSFTSPTITPLPLGHAR